MRKILWLLIGLNLFPLSSLLAANDVGSFYAALKQLRYDQTSASTPFLHSNLPYRFSSLISQAPGGSLTSATITPPNNGTINTPQSFDPNNDGTDSLEFKQQFATLSGLNSNLANGQYSIHVNGANGTYNSVLTLNGDGYPAEVPQILNANFSGGTLVIDPTKPFTVTWNSFADHGANDVIGFVIDSNGPNVTFQLLPPTATSQVIPANTLQPGLTYHLSITFVRTFDFNTSSIPGSTGYGGYARQTTVNLSAPQTPNVFASINGDTHNAGGSIFEYRPDGTQVSGIDDLDRPRGIAVDGAGNLFVANDFLDNGSGDTQASILEFAPDGTQTVFGSGDLNFFISGLAFDSAGNLFAMAQNNVDPNLASVVYKFTPNGTRSTLGSIPGQGIGLAVDVSGNVFAPNNNPTNAVIYKFSPDGTRILFANATITSDQILAGMAFDKFGNLFVTVEGDPGNDAILKFTPDGTQSSFATGLTNFPRGLAFDSDGNLFVGELGRVATATTGDILKFTPQGTQSVFASGLGRPEGNGGAEYVAFEPFPVIIGGNVSASATVGQKFVYQISATNHPSFYDATGLPAGLSIDTDSGIIFGIPTNSGDSSVSISASNLFGTGTGTLNVSTQPAPAGPEIISSTAATGRTNQPFDFQILVDNASSSAQVTTSQLPAGLNFDPVGREISGTPTADGNFVITLTVTDGDATGTGTLQLTFTSDPTIPVVTSPDSATLIPNQPFTYTATSDAPGTTFSYIGLDGQLHSGPSSAGLPAGLSFDGVATISGTFTSAASSLRVPLPDTLKIRPPIICSIQLIANNPNGAGTSPLNFLKNLQATDQSDLFVEATSPNGAVVNYNVPTVTNDTGQSIPVTCDVLPGSNFPLGKTPVTCTAIDPNSGASAIVTFNVTVQDTTAPTITRVPTSITVAKLKTVKGQPQGATVNFADQLAATDIISGVVTPTANPPSGSFFPVGKTTVTVTATDEAANKATETFTVNVASKAPKAKAPTVTAAVSSVSINEGHSSTFTISVSAGSPSQPLLISYTMSGTAVFGTDYTLSDQWGASLGQSGTVFIPSGGKSGTITLSAPVNSLSSGNETATLTITAGSGYSLAKVKKGKNPDQLTVTINNLP